MKKLAIVTSHPIQYNAPIFKLLTARGRIRVKVFYTWEQSQQGGMYDKGFGKKIEWDIPLLEGYEYTFVKNTSKNPGPYHFNGIVNPTLNNEIKNWDSDAVLIYGWSYNSHLKCINYFNKKIPVLFRGDSTLLNDNFGIKRLIRRVFLKWVYSKVDYAFYVGKNNKAYYQQLGLNDRQLIFAPHAIDNKRFSSNISKNISEAFELRRKLLIGDDEIVFLYAGKLEEVKNVEILLQAFVEINISNAHLIIVGNGILESKLKEEFSKIKNLHFIGFQNQSNMPVIYNIGDVFVLPSKSETWGLVVNEAMACKKAVLISDKCGSAIDLVENGKNGFIFKSENLKDLKEKLLTLTYHKDGLKEMGNISFNTIQNYSYDTICLAIENFF
ncbi:MAG: glycosyltransferase [Segetibacter sp.]|nr:glycosyltransferase [Segetibacter sp.]